MQEDDIYINAYSYELPHDKIAQKPLKHREDAKMLIWHKQKITDAIFNDIPQYLSQNDFLIFNDTKVIKARLIFKKNTGAQIEIFCLHEISSEKNTNSVWWKCFVGNNKKWRSEQLEYVEPTLGIKLTAEKVKQDETGIVVQFRWNTSLSFIEILEKIGHVPLPPYIQREDDAEDINDYQTIFADKYGSVAAPTASLHFTQTILDTLEKKQIPSTKITLHVGAGTFKPVNTEVISKHEMHAETISFSYHSILQLINNIRIKTHYYYWNDIGTCT